MFDWLLKRSSGEHFKFSTSISIGYSSLYHTLISRSYLTRSTISDMAGIAADGVPSGSDAVIVVLGATGAGKSTFIQAATGSESVIIGHGLKSGKVI
jgi:ABC-type uncharacterized transport system ATPase subunit